jgi:hypothetical protein
VKLQRRRQDAPDPVEAISRPETDTHYPATALHQLAKEDDGTLRKRALELQAKREKKRR